MQIVELFRKQYQDYELNFEYDTDEYYVVKSKRNGADFTLSLSRERFEKTVHKRFAERLFQRYLIKPSVFSVEDDGNPVAFIELDRELWNRRLRITDLLVTPEYRRKGCGAMLIAKAKELAQQEGFRSLWLDTHTCNTPAIDFYLSMGFKFCGIDLNFYSNRDIDRKEVWISFCYTLKNRLSDEWVYSYEEAAAQSARD
jgi:ribosomal protein S18 acetylase RimI-like enzyme